MTLKAATALSVGGPKSLWIVMIGMANILTQYPTICKDPQSNARNVPTKRTVRVAIQGEVVIQGEGGLGDEGEHVAGG